MELRPADLGDAYQSLLVLRRAHLPGASPLPVGTRTSRRAKRWTRNLNLSDEVGRETLPTADRFTRPLRWSVSVWASVLALVDLAGRGGTEWHLAGAAACAAGLYVFAELMPGKIARNLYTRTVSAAEIEALRTAIAPKVETKVAVPAPSLLTTLIPGGLQRLLSGRTNEGKDVATLETEYFDLILASLRLPVIDLDLQSDLKNTLRQIGGAVASLRRSEVEEDRTEARDLVGDAEMLAARARSEHDTTVAASLLRQAQAKIAQAKMVEKNAILRRQTRALNAELRAQIAAAQASLKNITSQAARSAESRGAFRAISASVTTLASEADSMLRAHDELAEALGTPVRTSPVEVTPQASDTRTVATDYVSSRTTETEPAKLINRRRG